ncbi:MAG: hypothetical protein PHO72_10600 [Sphaerochaeta sp.]|nr:hypothetical protein [Sphaerochaeta sp.]
MMGIASIWDWQTISNERAYGSGLSRYLSKQLLFLLLVAFLLLYCSRDPEWTMAWRYVASLSLIMAVNLLAMNRSLLSERSKLQEGTKKWDVGLSLLVAVIGPFLVVVVASLDHRCHWGRNGTGLGKQRISPALLAWVLLRDLGDACQPILLCHGPYPSRS